MSVDVKDLHLWFADLYAQQRNRKFVVFAIFVTSLGVLGTFAVGYSLGRRGGLGAQGNEPRIWSSGPTIEHIQSLEQIVSTKVSVSDVMTGESDGVRGVWLIKGDALLGIDFSEANVQIVDPKKRIASIELKPPVVISARVDHERTLTWDLQRTTWIPWKGDKDRLRDKAMYHAQKLVEYAASQPQPLNEARQHASRAVSDVYKALDWQVEIRWKDQPPE